MIKVFDKAVMAIDIIASVPGKEWSTEELSKAMKMPVSTTHRILLSLAKHDILEQNRETKKFRLGWKLLNWGFVLYKNMDLRQLALPLMRSLTEKTKESSFLSILLRNEGMIIEKVDAPSPIRYHSEIGTRYPLNRSASARVLLAYMGEGERNAIIDTFDPAIRSLFREECERIREQGYAVVRETREIIDVVGIAAPVQDFTGKKDKAIAISGPEIRLPPEKIPMYVEWVLEAAEELTQQLIGLKRS